MKDPSKQFMLIGTMGLGKPKLLQYYVHLKGGSEWGVSGPLKSDNLILCYPLGPHFLIIHKSHLQE